MQKVKSAPSCYQFDPKMHMLQIIPIATAAANIKPVKIIIDSKSNAVR